MNAAEDQVFASIPEAIEEIRQGRMVIVVDGCPEGIVAVFGTVT